MLDDENINEKDEKEESQDEVVNEESSTTEETTTSEENVVDEDKTVEEAKVAEEETKVEEEKVEVKPVYNFVLQDTTTNTQQQTSTNTKETKKAKKKEKNSHPWLIWALVTCILCSACSAVTAIYVTNKNSSDTISVVVQQAVSTSVATTTTELSNIISGVYDTVVEVYTEEVTYSDFYGEYVTSGAGSGVIISSDGYILTCNHVIEDVSTISVTLTNGDTYEATLIGTDSKTDIAVIKIEATGLQAAVLGDSDELVVGQTVFAIGNPLGTLGGTVTTGVISATSREITVDSQKMTLLQTDAAINSGNSGGGLFNASGELIGIVNAKYSDESIEGLGFAIPSNTALEIATDLINYGKVTGRAAIGISVISIENDSYKNYYRVSSYGVYIAEVTSEAAIEAGLEAGDLIVGMDDLTIESYSDLSEALESYSPGDTVTLTVIRSNETIYITMELIEA